MRFSVDVEAVADGWRVQVAGPGGASLGDPRHLRRFGDGPNAFPLAAYEPNGLPQAVDEPKPLLPEELRDSYHRIIGRDPASEAVARFGNYLFSALMGKTLWSGIEKAAGEAPVELALGWRDVQAGQPAWAGALNRLPWEMMHDGGGFLAQRPHLAITRRLLDAGQKLTAIEAPPRVLFVTGTSLNNDVIMPGAEYLSLVRSLRAAGLYLRTHILLQASTGRLERAIEWFKPTVVHFICHGGCDDSGQPYLRLADHEKPAESTDIGGRSLAEVLVKATTPPQIVVLNACYTATVDDAEQYEHAGQVASPLAVDLVRGGVPIVVGMAGEVADRACRLFARRFYEALVKGEEIGQAVALGRRVGILRHGGDEPASSVDWAMPTLFVSGGVGELRLPAAEAAGERARNDLADALTPFDYPPFCGRLDVLHWCDVLMASARAQAGTSAEGKEIQVLSLWVDQADSYDDLRLAHQYGRTWLLHQLAARAARGGHVPVLIRPTGAARKGGPADPTQLVDAIVQSASEVAQRLSLRWQPYYSRTLTSMLPGAKLPSDFPDEIADVYGGALSPDPAAPRVRAVALTMDLLRLVPAENDEARLLLLFDDLHAYGLEAAKFVLQLLLFFVFRLDWARDRIRLVLAHSAQATAGERETVKEINDHSGYPWVKRVQLDRFESPEDHLVYRQLLLHWREGNLPNGQRSPLAIAPRCSSHLAQTVLRRLGRHVGGVPSRLQDPNLALIVDTVKELSQILREANDDDILRDYIEAGEDVR